MCLVTYPELIAQRPDIQCSDKLAYDLEYVWLVLRPKPQHHKSGEGPWRIRTDVGTAEIKSDESEAFAPAGGRDVGIRSTHQGLIETGGRHVPRSCRALSNLDGQVLVDLELQCLG
jgi:hypothetical protein